MNKRPHLRWLGLASSALLAALLLVLAAVKWRYGGGNPYPGVTTAPLLPVGVLEPLAELDYPPGNVAVSADGRVFFNIHPFAQASRFTPATVFELVDGQPRPYPSAQFQPRYQGVFGMTVDRQRRLWFTEPAGLDHERSRLLAFDLASGKQVFEHWFAPGEARFAQDLRVTPDGKAVILADTGLFKFTAPGLIVLDIATKQHRIRLARHPSLQAQDWVIRTPFGPHKLAYGLVSFTVGVDGIDISADGQWLYFGAMSHARLYRVPLPAMLDAEQSDESVAERIEDLGPKPLSDGIAFDREGRLLITDIENGGLMRRDATGRLRTLVKSDQVIWADGIAVAPDGALVFTDSAIPTYIDALARPPSIKRLAAGRPYRLWRIPAP
jgi:sugar lactone lactonase YvrE